jgi:hypothetical protein
MRKVIFAPLLLFCFQFINCEQSKNPIGNLYSDFIYPIEIGNSWEYDRTFILFNFRPDSIKHLISMSDTFKTYSSTEIRNKEMLKDSMLTYQFIESMVEDTATFTGEYYYSNQADGLYLYAYEGASHTLPKSGVSNKIIFRGLYFNQVQEITNYLTSFDYGRILFVDSLNYENPPLQIIKYPLKEGLQWTLRETGNPFRLDRIILSEEIIQVSVGEFDCIKIQNLYDLNGDNNWDEDIMYTDYLSNEGLIKRVIYIKDLKLTDFSGQVIGEFDTIDESILKSFILK